MLSDLLSLFRLPVLAPSLNLSWRSLGTAAVNHASLCGM